MTHPTIEDMEQLGELIYKEIMDINADSLVSLVGEEHPKQARLEELRLAAKWNGLALESARGRFKP